MIIYKESYLKKIQRLYIGNNMKIWKISSWIWSIIFVIGALFLWLRRTDGAGAVNNSANQAVSLSMWLILFIAILVGHVIWHHSLKKSMRRTH